jgi:hypothetical protein
MLATSVAAVAIVVVVVAVVAIVIVVIVSVRQRRRCRTRYCQPAHQLPFGFGTRMDTAVQQQSPRRASQDGCHC